MWSGWFAGLSIWALITIALSAEQFSSPVLNFGSWFNVFIVTYISLAVVLGFWIWPLCRFRNAYIDENDTKDAKLLQGEIFALVYDFVLFTLIVVFFIVLPAELDSIMADGNPPTWAATFGLLIAVVAIVMLYMIGSLIMRITYETTATTNFSHVLLCCRSVSHQVPEEPPVCMGGFGDTGVYGVCYWISAFVSLIFVIVGFALAIPFLNAPPLDWTTASVFLWPFWVALSVTILANVIIVPLSIGNEQRTRWKHDVFWIVLLAFVLLMVIVFSVLLLEANTISPHALATPLYVALGVSTIVLITAECYKCCTGYYDERIKQIEVPLNAKALKKVAEGVQVKW